MTPSEIGLLQDLRNLVTQLKTQQAERLKGLDEWRGLVIARLDRIDARLDGIPNGQAHRRDRLVTVGGASVGGGGVVGLIMLVAKVLGWV